MSGIPRQFFYIFHNKFSKQDSDVYIIIPVSLMKKLRIIRFDNISQGIEAISYKARTQIEVFKIPNPVRLHITL